MGSNKELSSEERAQIDILRRVHPEWSGAKIAKTVHRSRACLNKYLRDPENHGRTHCTGRLKVTNSRQDRQIARFASKKLHSRQILASLPLVCSLRTVNRRLESDSNFRWVKRQAKPALTPVHREARLQFAIGQQTLTTEWHQIIFSDEKKFNLNGPDGFSYYWHDIRDHRELFSRRFGGGSVMVWGAFGVAGRCPLEVIRCSVNAETYQDILLKPHALAASGGACFGSFTATAANSIMSLNLKRPCDQRRTTSIQHFSSDSSTPCRTA
ncbi:hypothetical protein B4U79_08769 [Dinothrombium tinctorium]|uniref:Tc3 transposase DNA binding domain-containing protein n=1 Tax=Dinothrombium tinctorium TaxID=1965070 RepID=A0A443QKH6_9ACAR|nr:hypothetical protein B4U79_08769 [Dinothrombium tinctorium]